MRYAMQGWPAINKHGKHAASRRTASASCVVGTFTPRRMSDLPSASAAMTMIAKRSRHESRDACGSMKTLDH